MGRRKIAIKRIDNSKRLNSCFSKRKRGFFKKMDDLSFLTGANICCIMQTPANNYFWHSVGDKEQIMEEMVPVIIKSIDHKAGKESHFFQNKRSKKNFKFTKEMKSKLESTNSLGGNQAGAMPQGPVQAPFDMTHYQQYLQNYAHAMTQYQQYAQQQMMYQQQQQQQQVPNQQYAQQPQPQQALQQNLSHTTTNSTTANTAGINQQQNRSPPPQSHFQQQQQQQQQVVGSNSSPPASTCENSSTNMAPPSAPAKAGSQQKNAQASSRGTSSSQKMHICTDISKKTGKCASHPHHQSHKSDSDSAGFLSPPALSLTPSLSPSNLNGVRLATPPTAMLMNPNSLDITTPKSSNTRGNAHHHHKSFLSPLSSTSKYPSPLRLTSPNTRSARGKYKDSNYLSSMVETPRFTKNTWQHGSSGEDFTIGDDIFSGHDHAFLDE